MDVTTRLPWRSATSCPQPAARLAPNALYWLGESTTCAGLPAALSAFETVLRAFPGTRKAPDALLKVGYCQFELKQPEAARATLNRVVQEFPDTPAAVEAQGSPRSDRHARRLGQMSAEVSAVPAAERLRITEIFLSLQGEARRRLADRVRAPDRLPAALPVLRHRLRLPRRRVARHRRDPRARVARATASATSASPAASRSRRSAASTLLQRPVRCRLRRVAGDVRRDRHRRGRPARARASST